jgi:hypothetical protein
MTGAPMTSASAKSNAWGFELAKSSSRDEFPLSVKEKLAARAGHSCSSPKCHAPTSGPQLIEEKAVNVGVASHISGAAPRGPRYDPSMTQAQRRAITNGIWLCQNCAKIIDNDEHRYPIEALRNWKMQAEQHAHRQIGKPKTKQPSSSPEREVIRNLKFRDQMQKDFLKTGKEFTEENEERRRHGVSRLDIDRPRHSFRHRKVIIRRLGNDVYPEIDDRPGISSWFKVELFDFYHNGIKVILRIESGAIEHSFGFSGNMAWALTSHKTDIDHTRFKPINIWCLGLIPFRNIRTYDLAGDEYYNFPHLYCEFNIDEMPYERFEHAVVGKDGECDWPLSAELRLDEAEVLKGNASSDTSLARTE